MSKDMDLTVDDFSAVFKLSLDGHAVVCKAKAGKDSDAMGYSIAAEGFGDADGDMLVEVTRAAMGKWFSIIGRDLLEGSEVGLTPLDDSDPTE